MDKVIFWDFDGTLAYRDGMFSKALFEVLDEQEKPHNYRIDDLKPFLQDGFPWHRPEIPHPELNDPAAWWDFVEKIFIREDCISSANIGYEKPHPGISRIALKKAGNPNKVWMIGDNYLADVKGAGDLGLKAILVRNVFREDVKYYAKTLYEIVQIIEND